MDNPFLHNSRLLLRAWKDIRQSLTADITDDAHIDIVRKWWSSAPLGKPYLDYLDPASWPDAWTLLDSRDFDPATISLGMFYTLLMAADNRWTASDISLVVLRSQRLHHENLCCLIRGEIIIGFMHDTVNKLSQLNDITVMHRYNYDTVMRRVVEEKIPVFQL